MVSLAVPVKDGVVLLDGTSWFSATLGVVVSTVKVTGELVPVGFPSELGWVASAVYCPLGSAGLALLEVQAPPVPVADAVETAVPLAVAPAKIWTVTVVVSLAVPVKEGVVLFDRRAGEFNVTVGAAVSTLKLLASLTPAGFPSGLC